MPPLSPLFPRLALAAAAALCLLREADCAITPTNYRVNYRSNAFPRHLVAVERADDTVFSWGFLPELRGSRQAFYHLLLSTRNNFSAPYLIYDSGVVASAETVGVRAGPSLAAAPPFTLVYWRLATAGAEFLAAVAPGVVVGAGEGV